MVATAKSIADVSAEDNPHSNLAAFLIETHYRGMGCDAWNGRRVQTLMAKLGDTPPMLAARMRIRPSDLDRRMKADCWTKQDGFILTVLEREIDFIRGGVEPKGRILAQS